jgi:hypothetical protein
MHRGSIGRRLVGDVFEIAHGGFLEAVDPCGLSPGFLLDFRQTADQDLLCLSAASLSRAFTEPAAFGVFTTFFDVPDPAFLAEPRHTVTF